MNILKENYERFFGLLNESDGQFENRLVGGFITDKDSRDRSMIKSAEFSNGNYIIKTKDGMTFQISEREVEEMIEYGESNNYVFDESSELM